MTGSSEGPPAPPSLRHLLGRLFLLAGAPLLLLGATGAILLASVVSAIDDQVDRLEPAEASSRDLLTALVDQQTGLRGYALTGRDSFLRPYRSGALAEQRLIGTLRRELKGSDTLLADLDRLVARYQEWEREYARPAVAAITRSRAAALEEIDFEDGQRRFDAVRAAFETMRDHLDAERAESRRTEDRSTAYLIVLFAGTVATTAAVGFGLWWALRREVIAPLDRLSGEVRHVRGGALGRQVHASGPLEIATLGSDVEAMRRRIAEELAALLDIEEQLRVQSERLEEQAAELRRSNTELEQFAYVASHDLQEPLRKVASFCQMLEQRYAGQLDERADQYIAFAVDGAKRMQALINDLLAFSRVGRTTDSFSSVDLGEAFAVAVDSLSTLIDEAGAEVSAGPLPTVEGDRTLLTQVFQNLIGNAVKFRSAEPPRVRMEAEQSADEWILCCTDNGIGIDAEYVERVFVIFQRLHSKETYDGTGIGLALCKKIMEFHGGRIWIDSDLRPEGGTRICLAFPDLEVGSSEESVIAHPVDNQELSAP